MSLTRIRELSQQIAQINEGSELQGLRTQLQAARKNNNLSEVRAIGAKVDLVLDSMQVLEDERKQLQDDLNRESRLASFTDPSGRREGSITGSVDVEARRSAVAVYNRSLKRHGVKALQNVPADVRSTVEAMDDEFWKAFVRCSQRDGGDSASRSIVMGAAPEYRDMGIGTNTLGGYFVPKGFVYEVEEAMKWYGSMLEVAEIMDTATGQPLPYPTANDTAVTGELVGEGQQVSDADVNIGQVLFGAYKFSTKMTKVSLELLQDSAFDVKSFLVKLFAIRLGRILNTKFTVGAGSTEPLGIVTAVVANNGAANATPAYGVGLIAQGSSANTSGAETGGTSYGSKDVINLEHTVDPAYRLGAKYMMHDQVLRFGKGLLDKYGRPLWKSGLAAGDPNTFNGYPYAINNDMAQIALNAKTMLFGRLDKYIVRRVKELGVLTLNERFADYGQVAYIGFARYDGNLLDAGTHPVNYLQQAAS
jgi:HK97 family phage major capsid protein